MKSKGIRIWSLLMALLLVSVLSVSAASANEISQNDLELKNAESLITDKSTASGFVMFSDKSSTRSGVTYDLDVTITGVKSSGSYWYNLNGDSTATASENIDYIQASGTLLGPTLTANYGPVGRYNDDSVVASGTLTDYYFWQTTYQNQGHGMYRIDGVNYYLDSTASITT
ncbi:hypothetical protein J7W08_10430 [Methanococcoides orientis]|uniref:hypothetical protein n=1 Tax=Methanococcoides orientis TaxID=2822137 RepID=UPI001E618CFE|nr:hypothetical protein [Methanococcoides orientis]UGV40470.1 hypothetical protein J7W08_10430 [Methanococcoides orientis]